MPLCHYYGPRYIAFDAIVQPEFPSHYRRNTVGLLGDFVKILSIAAVILTAAAGSAVFFVIGGTSVYLRLRVRDRRRQNEEFATQLRSGQGVRLSFSSRNYSHVPELRTNLRRSTHLLYGIISEGWAPVPSQESLAQHQRALANCWTRRRQHIGPSETSKELAGFLLSTLFLDSQNSKAEED
jgi:hypothetical protein